MSPAGSIPEVSPCDLHGFKLAQLERRSDAMEKTQDEHTRMLIRIDAKLDSVIPELKERMKADDARVRELVPRYVWPLAMLIFGSVFSAILTILLRKP